MAEAAGCLGSGSPGASLRCEVSLPFPVLAITSCRLSPLVCWFQRPGEKQADAGLVAGGVPCRAREHRLGSTHTWPGAGTGCSEPWPHATGPASFHS